MSQINFIIGINCLWLELCGHYFESLTEGTSVAHDSILKEISCIVIDDYFENCFGHSLATFGKNGATFCPGISGFKQRL